MAQIHCKGPETSKRKMIARRKFLQFLAASPVAATPTVASTIATLFVSAPRREGTIPVGTWGRP